MQQLPKIRMELACTRLQLLAHVYTFDLDLLMLQIRHFPHCLR